MLRRVDAADGIQRGHWLCRDEHLDVQRCRRRRRIAVKRRPQPISAGPNQAWSMELVGGKSENGRRLKCLTITDDFAKDAVDIVAACDTSGERVTRVLDRVGNYRGVHPAVRTSPGAKFTGQTNYHQCACQRGIDLRLIEESTPNQDYRQREDLRLYELRSVTSNGGAECCRAANRCNCHGEWSVCGQVE